MRRSRGTAAITLTVLAAAMVFAALRPARAEAEEVERIAENVYIGSIDVGGMTEEEADDAIEAYVREAGSASITLSAGERSITVEASELGLAFTDTDLLRQAMNVCKRGNLIKRYKDKKDLEHGSKVIPMKLEVDSAAVRAVLEENAGELDREAVDNGLSLEGGKFKITEGEQGIEVNIEKSAAAIVEYIADGWDGSDAEVELVAEIVEPRGSEEELARITDVLGAYTTSYGDSAQNRCDNIALAASKIDGTVLYPGEEFSVYEAIGPLDETNGYELAGAYENGQTVQSYGGGVCQVSTTLYNAVILAELEITERSNHSMIVNYVKPSMDAAIAGDYKDLKFVNNQDIPIYIEGYTEGRTITFKVYGEETRPSGRTVSYESEVVSENSGGTQYVATSDPIGYIATSQSSHTGYVARLWKVVTVDGEEESREVFNNSTYRATPRIVRVGTASADPNLTAVMGAAIATGDEAQIYAAIASCTAPAPADTGTETGEDQEGQEGQPAETQPVEEQPVEEQPAG